LSSSTEAVCSVTVIFAESLAIVGHQKETGNLTTAQPVSKETSTNTRELHKPSISKQEASARRCQTEENGQHGNATIGVGRGLALEMLAFASMLGAFTAKELHIEGVNNVFIRPIDQLML
jgi:hypothetical protein